MSETMGGRSVLVVDDEKLIRELLEEGLGRLGYKVRCAPGGREALAHLEQEPSEVVLTDIKMDGMDGYEFLEELRRRLPEQMVIMMTAFGSVDSAIRAIKLGAFDYIQKPCMVAEVDHRLRKAFEHRDLIQETRMLRGRLEGREEFGKIVARNAAMKQIFDTIRTVAPSGSTVLIQGENGTGKELVARALHHYSNRADKKFVAKNCAAIPDALLESELFGHVKGAFTGSVGDRKGIFEEADGGTLFLDEISEMPLNLQSKLLRVVQEGVLNRVGSNEDISVDVRLISSTNRDIKTEVQEGRFRRDLYYRLNVIPILLPPLRERVDDIPLLAEHFLRKYAQRMNRHIVGIDESGMRALMSRRWEGNVRELENTIERAVVMATTPILDAGSFKPLDQLTEEGADFELPLADLTVHEMEKRLILATLKRYGNNRTRTAEVLDISIRTLRNKLNEYRAADPGLSAIIDKGAPDVE
ncbi:MAG: sigma-54 dependent transcriptional regulator [bacterium]|nr:sigma-54 dependent transcriptional regulator [bacterium]